MANKYPRWKNILLLVIFILGFFYALPNLYPEEPVVQISRNGDSTIDTQQAVEKAVTESRLSPTFKRTMPNQDILLGFPDTDAQLNARDLLKNILGDDYTIVVNLIPSTPRWLQLLGAIPMRLGLDLKGGVHFTLQLDTPTLIANRLQGLAKNITETLREAQIQYLSTAEQKEGIVISFPTQAALDKAKNYLQSRFSDLSFLVSNPNSNFQLIVYWSEKGLTRLKQGAIEQTVTTLRNRVNELGIGEPIVQQQGVDRILVELPGVQDLARAQQILGGTATIEFHLVDITHTAAFSQTNLIPTGSRLYNYQTTPVLLNSTVVLSGTSITDASSGHDQTTGSPSVNISLGGGGESYFHRITAENIGKPLAIVYTETRPNIEIVNGKKILVPHKIERVISIATINQALGTNFQITGLSNFQESLNLSLLLRAGVLPAPIFVIEQSTIGPQLGIENIKMGFVSIVVGFILAIVFMGLYYRFFGIIANIALAINLILLIALLSLLGMTLTLPGMAGIVLTVGMAVDANVLIFERIREELRNGASSQSSIYLGYDRALTTIIDANITTLIVAVILFGIGTGAIKGFAITLTVGLLTSMLTSIMFTRALVNFWYGGRVVKRLSIGI